MLPGTEISVSFYSPLNLKVNSRHYSTIVTSSTFDPCCYGRRERGGWYSQHVSNVNLGSAVVWLLEYLFSLNCVSLVRFHEYEGWLSSGKLLGVVWWILTDRYFGGIDCFHHQGDDFIGFFCRSFWSNDMWTERRDLSIFNCLNYFVWRTYNIEYFQYLSTCLSSIWSHIIIYIIDSSSCFR